MGYDAAYTRHDLRAVFDLKGTQGDLADWCAGLDLAWPTRPNTQAMRGPHALCWIGPEHWLLLADLAQEATLEAALRPTDAPETISVVRVSDSFQFFDVTGPDALEVMAIACPLDLHPSVFGDDACTFSEVFGQKALVYRAPKGFAFAVEQSFGPLIEDYLKRTLA